MLTETLGTHFLREGDGEAYPVIPVFLPAKAMIKGALVFVSVFLNYTQYSIF